MYLSVIAFKASCVENAIAQSSYLAPRYSKDFSATNYVNPNAPKGGYVRLNASENTFDTFNPFSVYGTPVAGWQRMFATLMSTPLDDPTSAYSYAAQSFEISGCTVTFNLRKNMKFSDGKTIKASDIVFSFTVLREKGKPFYRSLFKNIKSIRAPNAHTVVFTLDTTAQPLDVVTLGQIPLLAAHYWSTIDFSAPLLTVPVTSGPYCPKKFSANKFLKYTRVRDWWGENIPINRGKYNFNTIVYNYFATNTVALEAFKRHLIDWFVERRASSWVKEYNFDAVQKKEVVCAEVDTPFTHGLNALFINTRRHQLSDVRVRHALALMFDFNWINKHLLHAKYQRNRSIFMNTPYGIAYGKNCAKASDSHKALSHEERVKKAWKYMQQAGWSLKDGILVRQDTGERFTLDIILDRPSTVRLLTPYMNALKRLGIHATIRLLDSVSYQYRKTHFDYDMILSFQEPMLVPDKSLIASWGHQSVRIPGSSNLSAVSDEQIDFYIDQTLSAGTMKDVQENTCALDNRIDSGYYFIPMWHRNDIYIAYWNNIKHPDGVGMASIDTWWAEHNAL